MTRQIMGRVVCAVAALFVGIAAYVAPAPANMPGTFMPISASGGWLMCSGGTVTFVGGRIIHTFTASGTLVCSGSGVADYLIIGGGSGGNKGQGSITYGKGGASGVARVGTTFISSGSTSVTIGSGSSGAGLNADSLAGGNSSFNGIVATGGYGAPYVGSTGAANDDYVGGTATGTYPGGGGAGASGNGNNINGGPGYTSSISGTAVCYAGGGAGRNLATAGSTTCGGGANGGGNGSTPGSGGGGDGGTGTAGNGANGGVIVSYFPPCTGGTVTFAGGKVIHTFTASGTLVCSGSGVADYLIIGGGSGGNKGQGSITYGKGGASGVARVGTTFISSGSTSVTIGSGSSGAGLNADSLAGGNSSFNGIVATGGRSSPYVGPTGAANDDYVGGTATGTYPGGGGAGAGGNGNNINGGPGYTSSISGTSVCYAGGGAGRNLATAGSTTCGGGANGGGNGSTPGSGGGGDGGTGTAGNGANGGVIVSYN